MKKLVGEVGVYQEHPRQKEHHIRVWHVLAAKEGRCGQSTERSEVAENVFNEKVSGLPGRLS